MATYIQLFIYFLYCVLYTSTSQLKAQGKSIYKSTSVENSIQRFMDRNPNIDSLWLQFSSNTPSNLEIFNKKDVKNSETRSYGISTFYDLNFEGDQLLLKEDYPLVSDFIKSPDISSNIRKPVDRTNFRLVISRNKTVLKDTTGPTSLYAFIPLHRKNELIKFLNFKYKSDNKPSIADSILLVQAVVNKKGEIEAVEILYGKKNNLFSYFFKNLDTYIKTAFNSSKEYSSETFIRPYMHGGRPWDTLIDIYIHLNPDATFTMTSRGRQRKLRIKDFKDNPSSPLVIL